MERQLLIENYKNFLEGLTIFDLWFIIKIRQVLRLFVPLITTISNLLVFTVLVTGLLLVYGLISETSFYVVNYKDSSFGPINDLRNCNFMIYDEPKVSLLNLKKKIITTKFETMYLEKLIHRMRLQNHFHNFQRNLGRNLADFASEAVGGMVIATPDTQSYTPESVRMNLFGIPIWKPNYYTPRKVIQPWSEAGECWAFRGSEGKIEIELAYLAIIDHVTLEHISRSLSLTGKIDSAPKDFNVLGKIKTEYVMIDSFTYNHKGLSSQTFEIKEKSKLKYTPIKRVILEILSNWGNVNYTCIYRFKVHGKIYNNSNEKSPLIVQ